MSAVEIVEEDIPRAVMVRDIDLEFLEEEARKIPSLRLSMPIKELVEANEPHKRSKAQPRPLNVFFLFRKNWLAGQRPLYKERGENMAIRKVTPFIKEDWENSSQGKKQFFQWAEKCHKDKHKERYPDYQFKRDGLGKKKGRPRNAAETEQPVVADLRKRKLADSPPKAKRNKVDYDNISNYVPDDVPDDDHDDDHDDDDDDDDGNDFNYGDDCEGAKSENTDNAQHGDYIDYSSVYHHHQQHHLHHHYQYTNTQINETGFPNDVYAFVNTSMMISNAVDGDDNDNVANTGGYNDIDGASDIYKTLPLLSNIMTTGISTIEPYDGNHYQLNVCQAQNLDVNANFQTDDLLIGVSGAIETRSIVPLDGTYDSFDDPEELVPADEECESMFTGTPSTCFSSFPPTPVDTGSDFEQLVAMDLFDFSLYPSPTIG